MARDNKMQDQSWGGGVRVPAMRRSLGWVVLQTACRKRQARWVVMESSQVALSPCSCKDKCFAFSLGSPPN